jgi:hypothetical protein
MQWVKALLLGALVGTAVFLNTGLRAAWTISHDSFCAWWTCVNPAPNLYVCPGVDHNDHACDITPGQPQVIICVNATNWTCYTAIPAPASLCFGSYKDQDGNPQQCICSFAWCDHSTSP